jgi:hypothetical protein
MRRSFFKEELEIIDIYESEHSLTKQNEILQKIEQVHAEAIEISNESNNLVPLHWLHHDPLGNPAYDHFSSHTHHSVMKDLTIGTRSRKFISESDEDNITDIKVKSAPQKRSKSHLCSPRRESLVPL